MQRFGAGKPVHTLRVDAVRDSFIPSGIRLKFQIFRRMPIIPRIPAGEDREFIPKEQKGFPCRQMVKSGTFLRAWKNPEQVIQRRLFST